MRCSLPGVAVPSASRPEDLLLLLGPRAEARLLLVIDRLALDLVDDLIDGGLVARALCVAVERLAIDDERDIGHVRVGGAAMLLVRELDDDVRAVVQQTVQPSQPALGVVTDPLGDLDVLALDDRPHASPPRCHPGARASGSSAGGSADGPISSIDRSRRLTVHARRRSPRPRRHPSFRAASPHAARVAPVVTTSSTSSTHRPATARTAAGSRLRGRKAPATLAARWSRPSSNCATVARPRSRARARGRPSWAAATAAMRAAWS